MREKWTVHRFKLDVLFFSLIEGPVLSTWTIFCHPRPSTLDFTVKSLPQKFKTKLQPHKKFDMRTIYEELMINHWGLARPNLLISVTGIADDIHGIDGGLIDYFRRGLYESANSTQAWIISGGMNAGVMKEVGKARRKYSSAYGDEVPIIALPMWNEIE